MLIALGLAAALTSGDPEAVVTTAPVGTGAVVLGAEAPVSDARLDGQAVAITPHNLTTQQQIERWLAARATDVEPFAEADGQDDDRRMHGFVSGSIGTNDFSQVAVGVSIPVGENGRLDLAYSQTRNGWYGYGPYDGIGRWEIDGPYPYLEHSYPVGSPWPGSTLVYPGDAKRRGQSFGLSYRSDEERPRRPFDRW
ncbi:hypothetical protein [Brevundimonas sp. AAP58]|uniref:hypothetical protein n=1 Tax=Brevundimonas sp. AAP58 TaxID=1523422 RepID=UPI0006B944B0|nr:hypothetical protein [Brevundimonas sp. AAP58]